MSLQTELTIMDTYRNYMKEQNYKNEMELVFTGDLKTVRNPVPVPEPEAEHGKKGFFRR